MTNRPGEREITEAIEKILRRREFGGAGEPPLGEELVDSAGRALAGTAGPLGGLGMALAVSLAVAALLFLIWLLWSERRRRLMAGSRPAADGPAAAADPLVSAEELARKGNWEAALVTLFALHLRALQQQGWLVLEKSKTGLQYQWELRETGYGDVEGFGAFRQAYNRVRYGGYSQPRETYEDWLAYCREAPKGRRTP